MAHDRPGQYFQCRPIEVPDNIFGYPSFLSVFGFAIG
jgi:hypothetical protein